MRNQLISFSPSVNCEPGHHVSGVPLLHADVDRLPPPGHVRVPDLRHVRGVDGDVGVDVGRVDPLAGEVLGEEASGLNVGALNGLQAHSLGGLRKGDFRWKLVVGVIRGPLEKVCS